MVAEDFSLLENIVKKNIAETSDPNKFDWKKFVSEMEVGFTQLGFRDDYKLSGGGGVENILINCEGAMGDLIVRTPAIREIRRNFPFAKITLMIFEKTLVEKCPYVNEILTFEGLNWRPGNMLSVLEESMKFAKKHLWSKRFRLAFYFRTFPMFRYQLFTYISGAKERVGGIDSVSRIYLDNLLPQNGRITYKLLTSALVYPKKIFHVVDIFLYMLKGYGLRIHSNSEEVWYNYSDLYQARNLLGNFGKNKIRIATALGSSDGIRVYPTESYLKVFKQLVQRGAAIVLMGGAKEIEAAKYLQENLPDDSVLNLVNFRAGWRVDIAVLSQLDMYVGHFTGLFDMAQALHKPVIGLSCCAKDREWHTRPFDMNYKFYPYQTPSIILCPEHPLDDCAELSKGFDIFTCKHTPRVSHCITQIEPSEVVAAYDKMVDYIKTAKKFGNFSLIHNTKSISSSCSLFDFKRQKSSNVQTNLTETYKFLKVGDELKIFRCAGDSSNLMSCNMWSVVE